VGGYTGTSRQGEERAFALKMLARGYIVRQASMAWIDHFPKVHATERGEVHYWNLRNSIEFGVTHVPFPNVLMHCFGTTVKHFTVALKSGHVKGLIPAIGASIREVPEQLRSRNAVQRLAYQAFRKFSTVGEMRISGLQTLLSSYGIVLAGNT
jgi:hypothetical protein